MQILAMIRFDLNHDFNHEAPYSVCYHGVYGRAMAELQTLADRT